MQTRTSSIQAELEENVRAADEADARAHDLLDQLHTVRVKPFSFTQIPQILPAGPRKMEGGSYGQDRSLDSADSRGITARPAWINQISYVQTVL